MPVMPTKECLKVKPGSQNSKVGNDLNQRFTADVTNSKQKEVLFTSKKLVGCKQVNCFLKWINTAIRAYHLTVNTGM